MTVWRGRTGYEQARGLFRPGGKALQVITKPAAAPGPAGGFRNVRLSELLRQPVTDTRGESIGRLSDVIVRLRGADFPVVTGVVVMVEKRSLFVPIDQVGVLGGPQLRLSSARLDLRQFERREGEVLLRADVLGHRLLDVDNARLIRAADLELAPGSGEWVVSAVASHRRPPSLLGRLAVRGAGQAAGHSFREWAKFEPLIGHTGTALARRPFGRVGRLKPAQIADLLEGASQAEETEILGQVHADPELEADVFEELDEDLATRLLGARTDEEIAQVLARMQPDDAADAIAELPQRRRQPVLDRLPPGQQEKVMTLLGYNPTSGDGHGDEVHGHQAAGAPEPEALTAVAGAGTLQPEALTAVHVLNKKGKLAGVARLVELVQADPAAGVGDVADADPVRVTADADAVDVAVLMSDYNLITIPVVNERRVMIGVITVDDVLEATLPAAWRRREAAEPPDAHGGEPDT